MGKICSYRCKFFPHKGSHSCTNPERGIAGILIMPFQQNIKGQHCDNFVSKNSRTGK